MCHIWGVGVMSIVYYDHNVNKYNLGDPVIPLVYFYNNVNRGRDQGMVMWLNCCIHNVMSHIGGEAVDL
jgi:hypothetical protein